MKLSNSWRCSAGKKRSGFLYGDYGKLYTGWPTSSPTSKTRFPLSVTITQAMPCTGIPKWQSWWIYSGCANSNRYAMQISLKHRSIYINTGLKQQNSGVSSEMRTSARTEKKRIKRDTLIRLSWLEKGCSSADQSPPLSNCRELHPWCCSGIHPACFWDRYSKILSRQSQLRWCEARPYAVCDRFENNLPQSVNQSNKQTEILKWPK